MEKLLLLLPFLATISVPLVYADQSNPNLYVSAENSQFENHFAGSMVIEVIVMDPLISDTDEGKGEPNVTINGKDLRMVQATDGSWYAYFANKEKAQIADEISSAGLEGEGLDFGEFCGPNTDSSILGISFSNTEGIAVPRTGLGSSTNGESDFVSCTGTIGSGNSINNVVRNPESINTNTGSGGGQIGLEPNAWPFIQLFSFSNQVEIQYNRAGETQEVILQYDTIPNISLELDREQYPRNAEIILTLNDIQLNQDPTDEDSWTFNIDDPVSTFYQAFDENGKNAANGGIGLIDIIPNLSQLDFEDNGILTIDLNSIVELKSNDNQPITTVTDGTDTFTEIVTLVETRSNSGQFISYGNSNQSVLGIEDDAPRGQAGIIEYNDKKSSILSGSFSASVSLNGDSGAVPGKSTPIQITDPDQNFDTNRRDVLDVFRSSAIIPSLQLGSPITLESVSSVRFYPSSGSNLLTDGTLSPSSIPDTNSDRLLIDSGPTTFPDNFDFEMISIDLGITANDLQNLLIDTNNPNTLGTNWINFDLRSLQRQLALTSFSQTNMTLNFGLDDTTPVLILDPGDISSGQGLVQIDDDDILSINSKSGNAFLVINFDSSNTGVKGTISSETDVQPIVFDLFSFGQINDDEINNAIYRFELEETSLNSGIFEGTLEYSITNQVNLDDPYLINSLRTISDDVKFLVSDKLLDEEGINISYSDVTQVGNTEQTSVKSDIPTHSGTVGFSSPSYRFGQPVIVQLVDPDLNLDSDKVDIYTVIDNPASDFVDTVGDPNGAWLLEIIIKDVRYQRCTVNGVSQGGLASTGFTLIETSKNSGIFEGSFKMPSQICDKTGTKLISTAGGSVDAKYNDFRDELGESNIFETGRTNLPYTKSTNPQLNSYKFLVPEIGKTEQVILDGSLSNYQRGTTIEVTITGPDGNVQNIGLQATNQGNYRMVSTLTPDTKPGTYGIQIDYQKTRVGALTFDVIENEIPSWIKNNARWWSSDAISEDEFISGIEHLIKEKIIQVPQNSPNKTQEKSIPDWIKNSAKWWSEDIISDDEFVNSLEFLVNKGIIRV